MGNGGYDEGRETLIIPEFTVNSEPPTETSMPSLQEQLLKAGLADEKKHKAHQKENEQSNHRQHPQRGGGEPPLSLL